MKPPTHANLINTLFALISKLPPEGLALLEALVRALVGAKDPMIALRIASLSIAGKAGVHELYDQVLKLSKVPARKGVSRAITEADAKRLREAARG